MNGVYLGRQVNRHCDLQWVLQLNVGVLLAPSAFLLMQRECYVLPLTLLKCFLLCGFNTVQFLKSSSITAFETIWRGAPRG